MVFSKCATELSVSSHIKHKTMINNKVCIRVLYRLEQNIGDAACILHNNILYNTYIYIYRMAPGVSARIEFG